MFFSALSGTIATMEGLLLKAKASFRSLGESFGYGTIVHFVRRIGTLLTSVTASSNDAGLSKSASPRSELARSTRSENNGSTLEPPTAGRDIPGAFPTDSEKHDIHDDVDPSKVPLPASIPDDQQLPDTDPKPTTPIQRKRKRDTTELPSQKPLLGGRSGEQSQARSRIGGKSLWRLFSDRSSKVHDELNKENGWSEGGGRPSSRRSRGENESKVTSVLRDLSRKRHRQPKRLQPPHDATRLRPVVAARPQKRLRRIPAQREDEDSEDELAAAEGRQAEDGKLARTKAEHRSSDQRTVAGGLLRSLRAKEAQYDGTVDTRRIDLDSIFDKPDVGLRPTLSISNFMKREIEEERRLAEEERKQREEEERRAKEEKERKELEEKLAKTGGLRIPKQPFVVPVGDAWERRAYDTLDAAPNQSLAATAEGTELRRHDFAKVVPATVWLNDEIVNGALLWLDRAINSAAGIKDPKKQTRKCLALSSFFWKRLVETNGKNTQRTLRRSGVEQRNFLDVETILLPICENSHWTLVVIRPTKRTIAYMDSMRPDRPVTDFKRFTNLALNWLRDVLGPKFEEDRWKVVRHDAPRQSNGWDCGVFTITNAMCIALGLNPIDSYQEDDMPAQRIRIACMLLNNGFSGDFDLMVY